MSEIHEHSVQNNNTPPPGNQHTGMFATLIAGLVIALAGLGYLAVSNNHLNDQIAQMHDDTQSQISKLSTATTSLLEERLQAVNEDLNSMKSSADKTTLALRQSRLLAQKQNQELQGRLEDQQKQTSDEIAQLKDSTSNSISEVSTDLGSVKTDVGGVRSDVTTVKSDLNATQSNLEKTSTDLKRAIGDMGVMSGLIATNAKDLTALRALGERNYTEFDITRKDAGKKIGDMTLTLKKADTGRNRYTVEVFADDKHVEKRDRTINEPVQVYLGGNRLPSEIVVNQVKKDEIVGYISTPKMALTARNQ